ncbi:MAG: AbrB/MazE/SpoVT family DNA-binding domain-containing protein, partial [Bacillota bacterium]
LRKVGDSYVFTIPKELIEKYDFKEEEKLYIIENEDGFTVTPFDPEIEEWAKGFDKTNQKYKNILEELAKSLDSFSDDFLENRNQPEIQNREEL